MKLGKHVPEFLLPIGIVCCLMVIFVPLPAAIMDVLLAANIATAVMILLATIYIRTPLEFSVFPAILLVTTLARLALNIGTTRLILTRGPIDHEAAAGGVIQSFSQFVTGDNLAVGLVIFAIIFVIQFVVITKGATRISEVAARFALDGLPGRQMSIDADLNSGAIDNETASVKRQETMAHADFYGAMDGASKFVRGDAIAAVVITAINIIAGLVIGLSQSMTMGEAATTFTMLTIGDGLASQLPALLISLAAALLVTRSTRQTNLARESMTQIFGQPVALIITAAFLGLMVLTDLPKIPLLIIAAGFLLVAYVLIQNESAERARLANQPKSPPRTPELTVEKLINNDVVEMELGVGLLGLADTRQGGDLLALITQIRKQLATEMGLILPKIRVRDNLELANNQFQILIQGNVVDRGQVEPQCCVAIDHGRASGPLPDGMALGIVDDCLTTSPGYWVSPENWQQAHGLGYEIKTAPQLLASQLKLAALEHADQLMTKDATKQLIEGARKSSPAVIEELLPSLLSLGQLQRVLKNLLSQGVSIRPLNLILETLSEQARATNDTRQLTEHVRIALGRHISNGLASDLNQPIPVFTFAPELETRIACAWDADGADIRLKLPATTLKSLSLAIEDAARSMTSVGLRPIGLVRQEIRPVIAELAQTCAPEMFVLGTLEAENAKIEFMGEVTLDQLETLANVA